MDPYELLVSLSTTGGRREAELNLCIGVLRLSTSLRSPLLNIKHEIANFLTKLCFSREKYRVSRVSQFFMASTELDNERTVRNPFLSL